MEPTFFIPSYQKIEFGRKVRKIVRTKRRIILAFVLVLICEQIAWAEMSVVPLPAISYSRNQGSTTGALAPLLFVEEGEIYRIMVPMVTYNGIVGTYFSLIWMEYLEKEKNVFLGLSQSTGIDFEYDLSYRDFTLRGGKFGLEADFTIFRDSTYRFFGFGARSAEEDETNYTQREAGYLISLRFQSSRVFRISLSQRVRDVEISEGRVSDLTYLLNQHPDITGGTGSTILGHRLTVTYDSRDMKTTPLSGALVNLYTEINRNFEEGNDIYFLSSLIEGRMFFSSKDGGFATALRGALFMTGGHDIPFYEQAILGGRDSLRNYGENRFVDNNYILVNIEERIRIASTPLFGVVPEFQVAPFIDVGRVFNSFSENLLDDIQVNPGIGFRGIVRPQVVGRVDIGFGRQGVTFFVGMDFPF